VLANGQEKELATYTIALSKPGEGELQLRDSIPDDFLSEGGGENQKEFAFGDVKITVKNLYSEYRVIAEKDPVITIQLAWPTTDITKYPQTGSTIKVDNNTYSFQTIYAGVNYSGVTPLCKNNDNCAGGIFDNSEGGAPNIPSGDFAVKIPRASLYDLPEYKKAFTDTKDNPNFQDKPIFDKDYVIVPVMKMAPSKQAAMAQSLAPFTIRVFANAADFEKGCKADAAKDPKITDGKSVDEFCKDALTAANSGQAVGWGDPKDSTTGASETPAPNSDLLGPVLTLLSKLLAGLIWFINGFLYVVFFSIINPFIEAMLSIRTYTNSFAAIIYPGWEILRNLANIFFIISLLIIALTTIFRVQGYQWKHMLVELIIAAVLVNFSLVIGQAVLGIAETVQNQFLPNNAAVTRTLGRALMLAPIQQDAGKGLALTGGSGLGDLITPLFYLALALGSFLTFLAIAIMLVIRMIMLWILLMLSPVAFAARVLHATEHFAKEWWDHFLKYAFFVPIMALFLNIAALIVQEYPSVLETVVSKAEFQGDNLLPLFYKSGATVVILLFLIVSLKVANAFSIKGAEGLTALAQKGMNYPLAKVKQGGNALKGYLGDQATDKVKMPIKQGLARMATAENKAPEGATGRQKFFGGLAAKAKRTVGKGALMGDYLDTKKHMRDEKYETEKKRFGSILHDAAHGPGTTTAQDAFERAEVAKKMKDYEGMSAAELKDAMASAMHSNNKVEITALIKQAFKDKEVDAVMEELAGGATGEDAQAKALEYLKTNTNTTEKQLRALAQNMSSTANTNKQMQNVGMDALVDHLSDNGKKSAFDANGQLRGRAAYEKALENNEDLTALTGDAADYRNAHQAMMDKRQKKVASSNARQLAMDYGKGNFVDSNGKVHATGADIITSLDESHKDQKDFLKAETRDALKQVVRSTGGGNFTITDAEAEKSIRDSLARREIPHTSYKQIVDMHAQTTDAVEKARLQTVLDKIDTTYKEKVNILGEYVKA
jgi:hypothetical protein